MQCIRYQTQQAAVSAQRAQMKAMQVQYLARIGSVLIVTSLLMSCGLAPRGAALQGDILRESKQENADFDIVTMTKAQADIVSRWPATGKGLGLTWPGKGQSQPSRTLRAGDVVSLTIWENQDNSLLAAPQQRAVPMNGLVISPDGTIFVPYIDVVKIAGLSPEAARADIQKRLASIAPSAQVQLEVAEGDSNTIELVSGVEKPGRYPVAARGLTVLSMLAEAGGIPDAMRNPVVRLQRGGKSYAALADTLYHTPEKDIMLRRGDRIMVESDPRSFVLLGATGAERTVYFEKATHSMLEALSLANGLSESHANIRSILVLRQYSDHALRSDGAGPSKKQMVFTFDLGSADGLFAARNFQINPDDVIIATESPLSGAMSILSLVNRSVGLATNL